MKFDRNSLGAKIWAYFALFSAVTLTLIWLLQTVFLSSFYEGMKTKAIKAAAAEMAGMYGQPDFELFVDRLAYKNSILIYVTDNSGSLVYTSDEHGGGRQNGSGGKPDRSPGGGLGGQRALPADYGDFLRRLSESGSDSVSYKVRQGNFSGETLIYGLKLDNAALYVSSPVEALDATAEILRTQLIYATAIALLLGLVIAFFISKKLAKPIVQITNSAARLAAGDYAVQFEKGHYSEADALSATLNHTAHSLSKVEALRRELIANISHDLRTPLTMIKGYTEMIEEVSADDKEKRAAHLSIIKEETARLEGLVGDILQLSLLQSGNEGINPQNIDLSETVKTVLSRFEMLSARDGYAIQSRIEPGQTVFADKPRMEQVLYNLIGNAINYAGEGKEVAVSVIDLGGAARFEVQDNGAGIAEDELPFIWDQYYKSKKRSRAKAGSGIGLSIVKSILLLHNAKFGVDSEVGRGSTFWFELKK